MAELRFEGIVVHGGDPVEYARQLAASAMQIPGSAVDLDDVLFTDDPDGSTVISGVARSR